MRSAAALLLAVVVSTTACGSGKPPASAAAVAPGGTVAYVSLGASPERAESRRALALQSDGAAVQATLDRVAWARIAPSAEVAVLGPHAAVAYALPRDRKALERRLDDAGLLHARIRGWTAFTPSAPALATAKHARTHLADAAWFAAASRIGGGQSSVLSRGRSGWVAVVLDGPTVRRTEPGGRLPGTPHPLAARIPASAVFAAASHDFARGLRGLPYGGLVERGLGLRLEDLARATPRSAVLYGSAAEPFPTVTLLADGGTLAAGARVVRALDPAAPPGTPVGVGGVALQHVAFGAVDLYYGRDGGNLVITDDPAVDLHPAHSLEPAGLPQATEEWVYLDAQRGAAALGSLAMLAGTQVSPSFLRKLSGLRSVLAYVTTTRRTRTTTLLVQKMQ